MAKGKKTSLKASLSSQQSRLKKKQEAAQAAEHAERKGKKQPTVTKGKAPVKPAYIPFTSTNKILLVGEGNFSFTAALALHPPPILEYLPAGSITATGYDSEKDCYSKYPDAQGIVTQLREKGVEVIFGVDATKLEKCAPLKGKKYDKIMWNFPHAGKGITDQDRNILSNQVLLLGFLKSAAPLLTAGPMPTVTKKKKPKSDDSDDEKEDEAEEEPDLTTAVPSRGSILITLRNVQPYISWNLPKLAKNPPPPKRVNDPPNPRYIQLRSFAFDRKSWQGYEHRMTKGERAGGKGTTGVGGEDRTWEFCLKDLDLDL